MKSSLINTVTWLLAWYYGGVLSADHWCGSPFNYSWYASMQWNSKIFLKSSWTWNNFQKVIWKQCDLPWMNAMTFLLDQYFYLHIKCRLSFLSSATEQTEKVPYQARMCVKDSFVKCWQKPHKPLPSLSSPPTRPGGCQKIPQYGLVLAPCH